MKYINIYGNNFPPDIGSPEGNCVSPVWFLFYFHKALEAAQTKFEKQTDITFYIKHDHLYTKRLSDIDNYSVNHDLPRCAKIDVPPTPQSQSRFILDKQYSYDASWAFDNFQCNQ